MLDILFNQTKFRSITKCQTKQCIIFSSRYQIWDGIYIKKITAAVNRQFFNFFVYLCSISYLVECTLHTVYIRRQSWLMSVIENKKKLQVLTLNHTFIYAFIRNSLWIYKINIVSSVIFVRYIYIAEKNNTYKLIYQNLYFNLYAFYMFILFNNLEQ